MFANAAYFAERIQELVGDAGEGLQCVIVDAEAISDCDTTAAETLETVDRDLEARGVELWIARGNEPLLDTLRATDLVPRLGPDSIFPSVRAAVIAFRERFSGGS